MEFCFALFPFSLSDKRLPNSLDDNVLATSIGSDAAILLARKTSAGTCSLRDARAVLLDDATDDEDDDVAGRATRLKVLWLMDGAGDADPFLSEGMACEYCLSHNQDVKRQV